MLIPSIWIGLAGMALTAILLAADWYLWDPRCRPSGPYGPDLGRRLSEDKTPVRSAADSTPLAA
jgi:hypothetical protein